MVHLILMKLIKKMIHSFKNNIKIFIFKNFKNTIYRIDKLSEKTIIIHHHLGLGDIIICNGLVNYLSKKFEKIILPVYEKYYEQVCYLYVENPKIEVIKILNESEIYNRFKSKKVLRIGFEKNIGKFNTSFYKQLNIPYSVSFDFFQIPRDEKKEIELMNHLMKIYEVEKNYILVHRSSSYGQVDLKIDNSFPIIYIEKDSDIFNNVFLYAKLIESAKEIHCIDSSILHLVERVPTEASLFFHPVKKEGQGTEKLELYKDWNITI